jgi:hypothetical protein
MEEMTVRHVKLGLVLLALLAFPTVALASKPASASQKAALLKAFGDKQAPARCLTALISTPNRSWGAVYFTGLWVPARKMPAGCAKYAANGISIFHYRAGRWRFVTAGSSFVNSDGTCGVPHVPRAVIKDFRLCG